MKKTNNNLIAKCPICGGLEETYKSPLSAVECEIIKKNIEKNTERLCKVVDDMREEYRAYLEAENERLDKVIKEKGLDKMKLPCPKPMTIPYHYGCGAFEKRENMRCKGCLFLSQYHDMGMSCDICSLIHSLDEAAEATKKNEPCPNKLTTDEAYKYVENRNKKEDNICRQIPPTDL